MTACARCRKELRPEQARRVPAWVKWVASFSLAFAHGGMWANEELSRPYCARCRAVVIPMALSIAAVGLTLAGVGLLIWLRGP